jgi:hypothetical protein
LQKPGTSGDQIKTKERKKHESSSTGLESSESKGHLKSQGKRQRLSGGTPEGRRAKRPKQVGQLSYARAAWEGIQMAIVGEGYPGIQISRENFAAVQRAIGWLEDELPEEEFTPSIVDS